MAEDGPAWPEGDGEMAGRIRGFDWASTPLGAIGGWPQSLRTVVDLMLASPGVMSLVWGREAIHLYNDGFTELLREHDAPSLGRSAFEAFARSRAAFEADLASGMAGRSRRLPAQRYPVLRQGRLEDAWFDVDYAPVRDESGSVAGVLWTLKETTAQHLAEEALGESEARHRLLIQSWAQAEWETDAAGVVVSDSPSWRAYTGQTPDQWLGYGWLDALHPDDRAYAERQWRGAIAAGSPVEAEFRLRGPGGGWRWTNVRAAPVPDATGRIVKWAGINLDIDDRKRAEAALQESEELRRIALESGGMGAWRWDTRAGTVRADAAVQRLWGVSAEAQPHAVALYGDRMYPEGAAWLAAVTQRELAPGEALSTQVQVATGPTSSRWVQLKGRVDFDQPWMVNGVSFDITEQRLAEEKLRESERLRRVALSGGRMGAWRWDRAADRIQGDEQFMALWGFPPSDAAASLSAFAARMSAEGAAQMMEVVARAVACGEEFSGPLEIVAGPTAGSWVQWQGRAAPDDPSTLYGVTLSITEQKLTEDRLRESERRQQSLIEGLPQLVWRAVQEGRWTWASPQWTRFTGQDEAQSHGFGWLEAVHPDDREQTKQVWAQAVERGEFHAEYRLREARGGGYRWFQTRATPVRDDKGVIVEWLGASTDVQDLRALQERQRVLLHELQHRVRNTLAVVRSLARSTGETSNGVDDFQAHFEGRLSALARTQTVLTLSPGEGVDLEMMVREELLAQAAHEDRIEVSGPEVRLSPKAAEVLTLAVHELTTNAVKYGALGAAEGRVSVRWSKVRRGGERWLELEWRESGVRVVSSGPRREGFGTELLRSRVPYELQGHGDIEFHPGGVRAVIAFPLQPGESILQTDAPTPMPRRKELR